MIDRFVKIDSSDEFVLKSLCFQLLFSLLRLYMEYCSSQGKQTFLYQYSDSIIICVMES